MSPKQQEGARKQTSCFIKRRPRSQGRMPSLEASPLPSPFSASCPLLSFPDPSWRGGRPSVKSEGPCLASVSPFCQINSLEAQNE